MTYLNRTNGSFEDLLSAILANPWQMIEDYRRSPLALPLLRQLADTDNSVQMRIFLSAQANLPGRIVESILKSKELEVLRVLASNPNLAQAQMLKLARHSDALVRVALASNKGIILQIAVLLSSDTSLKVRLALASNSAISARVQAILSTDDCSLVRATLLDLSRLDEEVQYALCDDWDLLIHIKTLLTPRLSLSCLKNWAESEELISQFAIASRKRLPDEIFQILLNSPHEAVQLALLPKVVKQQELLQKLALNSAEKVRKKIAELEGLDLQLQRTLSQDKSVEIALALAKNPSLDDGIGHFLAESENREMLRALASNRGNLNKTRMALIERRDEELEKLLLLNPKLSADAVSKIVENCSDKSLFYLVYRKYDCSLLSEAAKQKIAQSELQSVKNLLA